MQTFWCSLPSQYGEFLHTSLNAKCKDLQRGHQMDLHPKQLGSAILYPHKAMILAKSARYGTNIDTLVKRTVQPRIYCKVIGPILTINIAHVSRMTNDDETPMWPARNLVSKFCIFKDVVIFEWNARSSTFSVNGGSKAHNIGLQQTVVTSGWQGWRCNLSRKLEFSWSTSSLVQTQTCFAHSLCQSPPTLERRNCWKHAE